MSENSPQPTQESRIGKIRKWALNRKPEVPNKPESKVHKGLASLAMRGLAFVPTIFGDAGKDLNFPAMYQENNFRSGAIVEEGSMASQALQSESIRQSPEERVVTSADGKYTFKLSTSDIGESGKLTMTFGDKESIVSERAYAVRAGDANVKVYGTESKTMDASKYVVMIVDATVPGSDGDFREEKKPVGYRDYNEKLVVYEMGNNGELIQVASTPTRQSYFDLDIQWDGEWKNYDLAGFNAERRKIKGSSNYEDVLMFSTYWIGGDSKHLFGGLAEEVEVVREKLPPTNNLIQ